MSVTLPSEIWFPPLLSSAYPSFCYPSFPLPFSYSTIQFCYHSVPLLLRSATIQIRYQPVPLPFSSATFQFRYHSTLSLVCMYINPKSPSENVSEPRQKNYSLLIYDWQNQTLGDGQTIFLYSAYMVRTGTILRFWALSTYSRMFLFNFIFPAKEW